MDTEKLKAYWTGNPIRLLVMTAMFITMGSILHIFEGLLPPLPVTGAKLGLANIITLAAIYLVGPKTAVTIVVGRTMLGSLFGTGIISPGFAMSFSGAILSWAVMSLLFKVAKNSFSFVGLSLAGAIAHNIAQLAIASAILDNIATFSLFPLLMFFAIPTGIMVGLVAYFLVRAIARNPKYQSR